MRKFLRFMFILLGLSGSILDHANALTAEDFYVRVIRQQAESGLIEEWSTEQKIQLVNWIAEAGIDIDDAKLLSLNTKDTSADDKEDIAEALIEKCYGPGRGGAITILDIMGKTKGDYETWTIEDKAWLTQMQQLYHDPNLGSLYPIQFLPDTAQGDILQEEAVAGVHAVGTGALDDLHELRRHLLNDYWAVRSDYGERVVPY